MGFSNFVDADMEDYGFEYSDEEQEEQDVDIENQYYNSKGFFFCIRLCFLYSQLLLLIQILTQ